MKETLKPADIANELGWTHSYTLKMINEGRIPSIVVGKREKFIYREAFRDWMYFGCLCGQKAIVEHIGADFDEMMNWIMAFRNYKERAESDLVGATKHVLREIKQCFVDGKPPKPELISVLEESLKKVEVFQIREERVKSERL